LPGLALVVLDQEHRTASHVLLCEDGHAQERSLLENLYPLVRRRDLWVADRNFCTVGFLCAVAQRQAFFALRQHGSLPGTLVGKRRSRGRGDTGRLFEQRFQVADAEGNLRTLRRVTVVLDQPTRDGDPEIHLLTNLPDTKASAATVADLYRQRWTIEGLFFEVAQTLSCEIDTLCYPKAALFAFCLGLLASNAVALLKGALRAEHGVAAVSQLSAYYLALEMRQTYAGLRVAIPAVHWEPFRELSATALAEVLRHLAGHVSLQRYRKTPRGPKKPRPNPDYSSLSLTGG
jgi:Transposase DDE domain